ALVARWLSQGRTDIYACIDKCMAVSSLHDPAADDARLAVTVYGRNGGSYRLGTDCSWAATALGADNRLYAITAHRAPLLGNCPAYSAHAGRAGSHVVAFSAAGARVWVTPLPTPMTPLPEGCGHWALPVDAL